MNEAKFWLMIEAAWETVGGLKQARAQLAAGGVPEETVDDLQMALEEVIPALRTKLGQLSAEDLLQFDRILERKLFDLDREEVHDVTDGSDDGFLYARGFIVSMGPAFYEAVNRKPSLALLDSECEEMCYLSVHVYKRKYGDFPKSDICRETGSNKAGWA
jgi:hypothetical protein